MRSSAIRSWKVTMSSFVVPVGQVSPDLDARRTSTIVKASLVRPIWLAAWIESVLSIVNASRLSEKVRSSRVRVHRSDSSPSKDRDGRCVEQNPCDSSPCYGNATCYNLKHGQYRCMCPSTYTGSRCESDIDECTVFPSICRNGGK